jgi:pimeloyl-ACP methyl ester carboxylesterase
MPFAAPVTPAQPPAAGPASPALHVRIGPDSNACGITLPSAKPRSKSHRKPGLIVWLHGGMRSQNREKGFEAHRALLPFVDPAAYYLCSPSAFGGQEWTTPMGLAHIDALIGYMEAHYAFDPADINLVGVSDGSLGVIVYSLQGLRRLHRRVLISSAPQLVLPAEALPGQPRFADGSWDFLQGGRDRLFPAEEVVPYLQRWEKLYPNAHLHYFPDGEHDFSFYAEKASGLLTGLFAVSPGKPK